MLRFSPNQNLAHLIHWFEWENDAFQKAREQDKPVMLFLSAFWCRYCQRMDEEAFSDRENMALLNAYFVTLRVEDAKRPDINARYNLNGWPTIAFFTPAGELLAAVNYLATVEFKELLLNVYLAYQNKAIESRMAQSSAQTERGAPQQSEGRQSPEAILTEITNSIMVLADPIHGGYGHGQKFIQAEANDFLLCRYEATREARFLEHVRLTLDRMREGAIHDRKEGGYFRTTSGADWSQPHREKLLAEHAGLLSNCLDAFRLTRASEYARVAEEIICYLDNKLFDAAHGAFFGCEDFLRYETGERSESGEFFTIIDDCIYADANAATIVAYLEAAAILNRTDCKERALAALEFLWNHCRSNDSGMYHYFDGAPQLPGLLNDQARVGRAFVQAYSFTTETKHLERAQAMAEFILTRLRNPEGGYFDLCVSDVGFRKFRLTEISQNGITASFLLKFAVASNDPKYGDAARWALNAFSGDFTGHGIHAAPFGQALSELLNQR